MQIAKTHSRRKRKNKWSKGDRAIHFLEDMIKRKSTLENGFPGPYLSRYHGVSTRHQEKKKEPPLACKLKSVVYTSVCV